MPDWLVVSLGIGFVVIMIIGALSEFVTETSWPATRRGWRKLLAWLVLIAAGFLMLAALGAIFPPRDPYGGGSLTSMFWWLPYLLAIGAYIWAIWTVSDHDAAERRGAEHERDRATDAAEPAQKRL